MSPSADAKKMLDPIFSDPLLWHPECPNWTIIDWEKFESTNPGPPSVYYPPQVDTLFDGKICVPAWWSGRGPWCNLVGYPCSIASWMHRILGHNARYGKFTTAVASEDRMCLDLLDPSLISPATPQVLRGLMWTRDNIIMESLMTFHSWAWTSAAKNAGKRELLKNPKNGDGVIGVGSAGYNWIYDGTVGGALLGYLGGGKAGANMQMSPDGKWIAMAVGKDFSANGTLQWFFIYVVQPEDKIQVLGGDEDGDDQHKVQLKPGDLIRMTWDDSNPYNNTNDLLTYMYLPRRIAEWDYETHSMKKIQPDFDDYRRRATASGLYKGTRPMCCGFWSCNMTPPERGDLVRKELAKRGYYTIARPPPPPEEVDLWQKGEGVHGEGDRKRDKKNV